MTTFLQLILLALAASALLSLMALNVMLAWLV